MKKPIDKLITSANNQILTDIELNALRDEFGDNRTPYDIHDLILADIAPEMLQALRQADSITIIAKHGQQELRFPLHVMNNGYQDCLQGQKVDINQLTHQHKFHKYQ
ncbi:MAG: hypothetical protein HRT97_09670 [Moritella sp.]|uniref:hypothetical protein n=1 Tax=Moritella sp. TaxID=78556 RepID=UPI0025D0EF28|nr:hypothetical protein [Moritella sp.]NQZ92595.1 hypothetical protein [Moritella sp.]